MTRLRQFDWPLISFFLIAYGLAWGVLGLLALLAPANGAASGLALLQAGEQYQFAGLSLTMAPLLLYLLTRLADFAFSIAGVVMIGWTTGRSWPPATMAPTHPLAATRRLVPGRVTAAGPLSGGAPAGPARRAGGC